MSSTSESIEALEVFYCYSHADERLQNKLDSHLEALKRQGLIVGWHDRNINAGEDWKQQIDAHLNTAQIILLLISSDFVTSDYCYSKEMMRALERHNAGEAIVVPVILRPVTWQGMPFSRLPFLPSNGKPVTGRGWHTLDEAFLDITEGIKEIIGEINKKRQEVLVLPGEQAIVKMQNKHILIVEDDSNLSYLLKVFLMRCGYKATVVTDGTDALEFIRHVQFDLLILDIAMPIMGGLEVIRQLRTNNNSVPIFVLSALSSVSGMSSESLEVDFILSKPIPLHQIKSHINAFFENPTLFKQTHYRYSKIRKGKA